MMTESTKLHLRVRSMTLLAPTIMSVVLESRDKTRLPLASPGAHLDLRLSPGLSRSYSIVGNSGDNTRYEIAVAKDPKSRGGSVFVHDKLRVGDELMASEPRNLFELDESAPSNMLVAGGIGITPIWSMVQRLEALGRPWLLLYAARSRAHAAYVEDIECLAQLSRTGHLLLHFDDENQGQPADLSAVLTQASQDAHLYCCGPQPMLASYEAATAHWPPSQVHLERFGLSETGTQASGFTVVLKRSGVSVAVQPDRSILDAVLDAGINAQYGCMQGSCGLCETVVLKGVPDHRDHLLSDNVKAGNQAMLICCSRSRTPELVLDL
jgi:vanillate O-demethylase ferredoxin subunit